MNVIDYFRQEFHHTTASLTGATAAIAAPAVVDLLTRIIVGIAVGVGTWIATKTISWALNRFRKNKCKSDCSDSSSPKKEH